MRKKVKETKVECYNIIHKSMKVVCYLLQSAVDEELANLNEVVMKRYDGGESKGNFDPEKYI